MKKRKAIVEVRTNMGLYCLAEIKGLKEGTIVEGKYNPKNKFFDFTWNGQDAMLVIGENARLLEEGIDIPYKKGKIVSWVGVYRNSTEELVETFDTLREAKKFVKKNELEGYVDYWYAAAEIIDGDGNVNIPILSKDKKEAIKKAKECSIYR